MALQLSRVNGAIVAECSDATDLTRSSMQTEISEITLALSLAEHQLFRHVIVSDSFYFGDAAQQRQPDPQINLDFLPGTCCCCRKLICKQAGGRGSHLRQYCAS